MAILEASPQEDEHRMSSVQLGSRQWRAVALWVLLTSGAAYLFIFEPGRSGFFPLCPFRTLTGFQCPGCGSTRALHQLLHGNVLAAFELNPLLIIFLPVLAAGLILYTWRAFTGGPSIQLNLPSRYIWAFSAVVVVFWVVRNTAIYPFLS